MLLSENVRRLILYEPPMAIGGRDLSPELERRMQTLIDAGEKEQALLLFLRNVLKTPEHEIESAQASPGWPVSVATAHTVPRECKIVDGYTFDPQRFRNMQTPTVFFVGSDSPQPEHGIAATAHAALPHSRIVLLPGEQHWALNTAPDLFVREVVKFLTEDNAGLRKAGRRRTTGCQGGQQALLVRLRRSNFGRNRRLW
jgi:pimeloyl-ACP methyl ester carboxylesterase